jgi:hypothetical protein
VRESPDKPERGAYSILVNASATHAKEMKQNLLPLALSFLFLYPAAGQSGPSAAMPAGGSGQTAVSYASVSQLNGLLSQLENTSKTAQADLVKLRIEKWKTDGSYKKQVLGNVDSIQRNLQGALPEVIGQLRNSPEDLPTTFKLYRNLDALYDVLGSVVEGAGAFGSKDDLQSLSNDLNAFEGSRRQLAERIESLSSAKEAEITRLRADLKTAQAAIPTVPAKKIVVDDTEPAKKPATKKKSTSTTKKPADGSKPAAGQPAQQPQNSTKPQ